MAIFGLPGQGSFYALPMIAGAMISSSDMMPDAEEPDEPCDLCDCEFQGMQGDAGLQMMEAWTILAAQMRMPSVQGGSSGMPTRTYSPGIPSGYYPPMPGPQFGSHTAMLSSAGNEAWQAVAPTVVGSAMEWPPTDGNQAQCALAAATSEVGVTGGSARVREYSQGRSEAWCADFVSWCFEKGGAGKSPFGHRAGVSSIQEWGAKNGLYHDRGTYTARPGDVVIYGKNQHVGIVERVDPDGTVHTVEGNTPAYGKRSGVSADDGAVSRQTLKPNSPWIRGYIDMQQYL